MSKDYKKLYTTLKNNLKSELKVIEKYSIELDDRVDLADKIESEGQISFLTHLFKEYIPELEGKKWGNVFLTKEDFKKWKKVINAK